tara:strand:+ start:512 stop:1033 length:522 start_codon:yes stop_codon:yes gene_type:complete
MTLLSAYLSKSKVKKVLASKPGQEGFSLIELVVVVAVLAVLSAIAIPQFTNISSKARAAAAANTVATVAKECAAKIADQGVGNASQYTPPITLQGYKDNAGGWYPTVIATNNLGNKSANANLINCPNANFIGLVSENQAEYPSFFYNLTTGAKDCLATNNSPAVQRGCPNGSW